MSHHHPHSASPSVPRFELVRVSSIQQYLAPRRLHSHGLQLWRGWSFAQAPQSRCQFQQPRHLPSPRPAGLKAGCCSPRDGKEKPMPSADHASHTDTTRLYEMGQFASTAPAMPTVELLLPPSRSLNEVPYRWFEWVCCANAARTKNEIWNLSTRERRRQPIKKPRRVAARLQETNLIHACHDERETSNPTAPTHAASPKQAATDPTLRLRLRMRLQPDLHRLGDRLVATPCPSFHHSPCRFALLPVSPALLLEAPPSPSPASWPYDRLGGA